MKPPRFAARASLATDARVAQWVEVLMVLTSPVVLYRLLRLQGMAPAGLPDPSMHTTFILDPGAIFTRYSALFTPTSRLREAARVGFLVPARLSYLLFGALPGFYVFRYVLALIAVVPVYLLLRKLYGRWAGFVGIAVVISSPVAVTAWGTDYPDSAAISYLTGALAALALSLEAGSWQRAWMLAATCLLTLTVWSHGVSIPLAIVMVVVYAAVRARRKQQGLLADLASMLSCAAAVTLLLAIGSKLLLGQFNFITPTLRSASYLSQPSQEAIYHSISNAWAPYDNYLLVPPAVALAFIVVFAKRLRGLQTSVLFIGVTGALQLIVFAYLQFLGSLQTLEQHYFSSTLWSSVNVLLALVVVEMASPIVAFGRRRAGAAPRWITAAIPGLIVLAVAIGYEIVSFTPHMKWTWRGLAVAAAVVAVAAIYRLGVGWVQSPEAGAPAVVLATGAVALVLGGVLVLTVAQPSPHGILPNTVYDPYPSYSTALGGSQTPYLDSYAVDAQIPTFVGNPTYKNEILLQWEPADQFPKLQGPMGIYHNAFTWLSSTFPAPGAGGLRKIVSWKAAQVVMMSLTGQDFGKAVAALAQFRPLVVRRGILSHGTEHLHIWLVDLERNI
ncbi:MAG: hypothetical protein ACLP0J_16115 [Solirubrobacteraceae bacterium]